MPLAGRCRKTISYPPSGWFGPHLHRVGLDKALDEEAVRHSAGEKQRLSLARIMLMDPEILLLDEPSASLEGRTEGEIFRGSVSAPGGWKSSSAGGGELSIEGGFNEGFVRIELVYHVFSWRKLWVTVLIFLVMQGFAVYAVFGMV